MNSKSYLKDESFLRELDNQVNKFYQVRIEILDKDENPVENIEGQVLPGSSINIDGNSSMRRTCSLNILATEAENDLTNIDSLLSINKKIRIFEGIKNDVNPAQYGEVVWFPLGVFVINQPSITHGLNGCTISLSCKDKMCLLNGECGGNLPTSVTFHAYDQVIGERACTQDPEKEITEPNNYTVYSQKDEGKVKYKTWSKEAGWEEAENNSLVGKRVTVKQLFYDIIQTLVCNFGGESLNNIFINDVPIEIKQLIRQTSDGVVYYNAATNQYTTNEELVSSRNGEGSGTWRRFNYNEDIGYIYTDFTYADMGGGNGELISNIGDNVCTILDKVKTALGNFEYFYDVNGRFIFQEVKNYLNNSYDAEDEASKRLRIDLNNSNNNEIDLTEQGLCLMDNINYQVDFYSYGKSVYTFEEGNGLITSFANTPIYTNLKNDYHIQGKTKDNYAIHYHLAIKDKPIPESYGNHPVTGLYGPIYRTRKVVFLKNGSEYTGGLRLASDLDEDAVDYVPADWRAELYIQGLEVQSAQQRPDVFQQELLDLFDSIYNFKEYSYKTNMATNPNILKYFIDYLEPSDRLFDCSIDAVGQRTYSYQQDNIRRLYNMDVPNVIIIDLGASSNVIQQTRDRCKLEGQVFSQVDPKLYAKTAIGTIGYTAQEVTRDLIYQYTNYAESITIQAVPIYYLEPNTRITVYDRASGIKGDYIIKSISLPLDAGGQMTISATRALERF